VATKCPKCDFANTADSKFCKECGTHLFPSEGPQVAKTLTLETKPEGLTRGTVFAGRYEILEELGGGGMGKVYRVYDRKLEEEVALKLIRPEIAAGRKAIERFRNEIKISRKITHKNVCRMHDLGEAEGTSFITMEYVRGGDLKSLLHRTKTLPVGTALSIARQMAEGLAEAHGLGVVHRDLKPGNIMIDKEGNAKIMDFGIARSLLGKGLTGEGAIIGTPEYMSPEQVEGKEADQRADIYSLGIILFEMVTGTVPFEGDTAFAVALKHKDEQPESPKKLNPQIPDDLSHLILKCLEKNRDGRYQGAGEMLSELTKIEQGMQSTAKVVPKRKPVTSREVTAKFSLRKLFIPALALAAIAVLIILVFLVINRQPSNQLIPPSHKQLTFTGDASWPAISPDGKFIAYLTGRPETGQSLESTKNTVWVQDVASGRSIEVFSAKSVGYLRWTPNGSDVSVFSATPYGVFLVPRLGGAQRPMDTFIFAWSPDGSRTAGGDFSKIIEIINRSTGQSFSITLNGPIDFFDDIDWSPVDERLLIGARNKEQYAVWTTKTDGSQQYKVVEDSVPILSPRWSSKGDAIFYLRGQSLFGATATELWKIPISRDSGKATNSGSVVLSGIRMGNIISLTKDGKYLLYTRVFQFSNLWLAKMEGSEKSRTVKTKQDGEEIAFCSNEGGKYKVWKVSARGERPYQFAKTELGAGRQMPWGPGSNIIYRNSETKADPSGKSNFTVLNPMTEEETPLVKDESAWMWMDHPCYSPEGKRVAVFWRKSRGLWVISLEDSTKKSIGPQDQALYPMGWSSDGKWVYAYEEELETGKRTYFMVGAENNKAKPLPSIPFTIEGKTYHKMMDDKPEIYIDGKTHSDVWVVEYFDQIIR
jgi:serine/threonine protein kinase